MKKLFTIVILCSAVFLPQQLRHVVSQSYQSLSTISFADQNTGWAAGYYENIYKTTDAGETWINQLTGVSSDLTFYSSQFLSSTTGFVGGGKSTVALLKKTTDGGVTWNDVVTPAVSAIYGINFIDEQKGWILSSSTSAAAVFKTTDGGANWTEVLSHTTGDLEALEVLPSGKGIVAGGGVGKLDIYYTSDGDTWIKAPAPSLGGFTYTRTDVHAIDIVNDNLVYAVGWGSSVGAQPSIILKSTNGGAAWTYMTQLPENRTYQNLNAVYFKDDNNGLAFGGGTYEGSIVSRTTDGGVTWIPLETGLGFTIQGAYANSDAAFFVGASGGIAKTTDFGNTFSLLTPVPGTSINGLAIINNNVYAAGYSGVFYKSTNKGNTWKVDYAAVGKVCPNANGMHFINENIGFLARSNRLVTKTTDGGMTWTKIMNDTLITTMINSGVYFFDENNGFVAGRSGSSIDAIYKTTNSGESWTSTGGLVMENLNDITFYDTNSGIAAGNDNRMLYTSDGGITWEIATHDIPSGTEVEMKSVVFINPSKAIAVGEKSYLISENAGANWKYYTIPDFTSMLEAVFFKNDNEGVAVGNRFIFKTTDGGLNWFNINDTLVTLKTNFTAVAYDQEGNLWVAGGSNIYTSSPFISVNDPVSRPFEFSLMQNYPNPFNPSTTIRFTLASEVMVSLNIYDVLGNQVAELVNSYQKAGEHQVKFNASKLSSGIYFCLMNAGGKLFTTKMTLLK